MSSKNIDNNDPVIVAQGLTKVFKDFWGRPKARAVDGIDFTVQRGSVFGLLGPNGSGKSTTVKMLLGLLYPDRGNLKVLGKPPRDVETKNHLGYLPEETYLYHYLTASESLDFFGALFGLTGEERRRRTKQLLDMVGLTLAANRPVGEFSKGMARRIGLAQALINDPEIVILDEPTTGLDPLGCREVKNVISLLAERGKTVILCSHLLADVEDVCDQVAVMYGGKVYAYGGLRELLKIEDKTRITAPNLDEQTLQEVLSVLRDKIGKENEVNVDHPSMNLESLFLDVIEKARQERRETAGAQAGGEIAEYLQETGEEMSEAEKQRQQLLAKLTEEETPAATETATEEEGGKEEKPTVDEGRLRKLSEEESKEEEEEQEEKTETEEREESQKKPHKPGAEAEEKLKNIMKE
ncbi:MAG: ABC transporter ATP-binding protein [Lentisphaeria bacterium]